MIYEWYSGSDKSGETPQALAELDREFQHLSTEERLERLQSILRRERMPTGKGIFVPNRPRPKDRRAKRRCTRSSV